MPRILVGQDSPSVPTQQIIEKFAANEQELQRVRASYSFVQEVRVQDLDSNDTVVGEYRAVFEITLEGTGKRTEKLLEQPASTLRRIRITREDLEDIRNVQVFPLTADDLKNYDITYSGKENVNEISCYVFEVKPKSIATGKRYFEGKVWVETQDLVIIKSSGRPIFKILKNSPENLFPRFETYRAKTDGYWFPSSVQAVDTLQFSTGPQRIREIVNFRSYKKP